VLQRNFHLLLPVPVQPCVQQLGEASASSSFSSLTAALPISLQSRQ
jgi:hypothetical protein